jgi:hypothetical protein
MAEHSHAVGAAPQKWALLIGINDYPHLDAKYNLKGCVNDVNAIERLLTSEQFSFPAANVLKLTSPAPDAVHLATRENILNAFRKHLVENDRLKAGDIVVIYYSGHGSQVPDEEGDEEDGYDETIVPCDCGPDRSKREDALDITDDEISELLDSLSGRTKNINLFFDSCHSGTITRAILDAEGEYAEGQDRYLPPATYEITPPPPARRVGGGTRSMGPSDWMPLSDGYISISACLALERAREDNFGFLGRKRHGILTYYLLETMGNVGPETTYYDIWNDVRIKVTQRNRWQNPQIEGAYERKVFGGASMPRRRYVEVTGKNDGAVTLAAGMVHNATPGSRFAIYERGVEVFDGAQRVAVVRLESVAAFESVARIESGDLGRIAIGAPAIEIEHDFGNMRMTVRVDGDDPILDAARELIENSPLLKLATADNESSVARVLLRYPLKMNGEEDTSGGRKLFIVGSGDGHPLVQAIESDDSGPSTVLGKLEHIARYNNLLAIQNPDPQSNLKDKVKLRLLKVVGKDKNGQDQLAQVERNEGGDIVLRVGEKVFLEVENLSGQDVHAVILDCDTSWGVNPIFPAAGAEDDLLPAGKARRTNRFNVNLPEYQKPVNRSLPLPREIIKVIVTTERVDFRSLWQAGTRALEESPSLVRMMETAIGGGNRRFTRSLEEDADPVVKDWATAELVFCITT